MQPSSPEASPLDTRDTLGNCSACLSCIMCKGLQAMNRTFYIINGHFRSGSARSSMPNLLKIHTKISHCSLVLFSMGGHKNISSWMGGGVIKISSGRWGGGCKNIAGVFSDIYDPPIPKKMVAPLHGSKWFSGVFGSFVLTCYMEPSWFPFSDL